MNYNIVLSIDLAIYRSIDLSRYACIYIYTHIYKYNSICVYL